MRLRDKVAAGLVRVDDNQAESQVDGYQAVVRALLFLEPGRGDQRFALRLPEVELRGEVFVIGLSDGSKVPAQSLRARLADMQCSTDGACRGKPVGCQVTREHECGALAERIGRGAIRTGAGRNRWSLGGMP